MLKKPFSTRDYQELECTAVLEICKREHLENKGGRIAYYLKENLFYRRTATLIYLGRVMTETPAKWMPIKYVADMYPHVFLVREEETSYYVVLKNVEQVLRCFLANCYLLAEQNK
nr:unnamed protein product [Callosobruchus analis]